MTALAVQFAMAVVVESAVREPAVACGLLGVAAAIAVRGAESLLLERHIVPAAAQMWQRIDGQAVRPGVGV